MDMLFADQQVDTGDGQDDGEQQDRCRGSVGRISAAVTVEHIVDVAHDGIHLRGIQVRTEECHSITVGLECADETGDDQVEHHGGDHGQRDFRKHPETGGAVHTGCIVVHGIHTGQGTGQDQNLKRHNDPDRVKTQHEHFRPVGSVDEVHGTAAEKLNQQVDQTVGVGSLLEQDHEDQTHGQRIGYVRQEKYGLEQIPQRLDGA